MATILLLHLPNLKYIAYLHGDISHLKTAEVQRLLNNLSCVGELLTQSVADGRIKTVLISIFFSCLSLLSFNLSESFLELLIPVLLLLSLYLYPIVLHWDFWPNFRLKKILKTLG